MSQKRQSYVHCVIQQLCQLTYKSGLVSEEQFSTVLVNLMSEVEAVESTGNEWRQNPGRFTSLYGFHALVPKG